MKSKWRILSCSFVLVSLDKNVSVSDDMVNYVKFQPKGKELVVGAVNPSKLVGLLNPRKVGIFASSNRKLIKILPFRSGITAQDGSYFVASGNPMKAFDRTGELLYSFVSSGEVNPVTISPDGKFLFGQGGGGFFGLWEAKNGGSISQFSGAVYFSGDGYSQGDIYLGLPVYFSKDSRSIYALSKEIPSLFEMKESNYRVYFKKVKNIGSPDLKSSDFDIDEERGLLCTVSSDPIPGAPNTSVQITLMNFSGKVLATISKTIYIPGNNRYIDIDARFSRDGRYVAVRSADEILVCSVPAFKVLRRYKPQSFGLKTFDAIDFSPTDNRLAFGGWGKFAPFIVRLP